MKTAKSRLLLALTSLTALLPFSAKALDSLSGVTWGGYADVYYAYDFNRVKDLDRSFTTLPARQNEFNLNLAFIEAKIAREKVRGRFALQAGTSVQSNYSSEPTLGVVSGPSLSRNVQEAYLGCRLSKKTWIDGGIFFSHIGLEGFIPRDNPTYTRSLVADFSPSYQTGVRIQSQFTENLSGQFLVLNGWQNISESNRQKAIGTQLAYNFSPKFNVSYNTFVGHEYAFRHFHDLVLKYTPSEAWSFALQADIGIQKEALGGTHAKWGGFTFIAKNAFTKTLSASARIEYYADPKQVIIPAVNGEPFRAWSASLGIDAALDDQATWRNEIRGYHSNSAIFASRSANAVAGALDYQQNDAVIVFSISSTF